MRSTITRRVQIAASLGLVGSATYLIAKRREKSSRKRTGLLAPKLAKHALRYRCRTSDLAVFRQIFIEREYTCLDDLKHVDLVIDCGAYIGFSGAYFLSRFSGCHVVAIEPDLQSFSFLKRNLAPYNDRVELLQAAVWSHPGSLGFSESIYRGGRAWTIHVRECGAGEVPSIAAVDIPTILAKTGRQRISILKVDIEGAEATVFKRGTGVDEWIDRVDVIAIELHDDSEFGPCSAAFLSLVAEEGFQISRYGELTICRRP
jgi:FkbM family methyltransferase